MTYLDEKAMVNSQKQINIGPLETNDKANLLIILETSLIPKTNILYKLNLVYN